MSSKNIDLIRQALNASESSIKLAKQLLVDLEAVPSSEGNSVNLIAKPKAVELPGVVGVFDGENMVSEKGETFPVPANYASKSLLVVGDTLKLVEEGKEKRFKQIEHVKRHKTTGILTKKEGKWRAVTPEGSYKVLPAAVSHFGADVGSEVVLHLPATNLTVPYGAIESAKDAPKSSDEVKMEEEMPKEAKAPVHKDEPKKEEPKVEKEPTVTKVDEVKKPEVSEEPKEIKSEPKRVDVKAPEPKREASPVGVTEKPKEEVKVSAPAPVAPSAPVVVSTPPPATGSMEVTPEEDELT